MNNIPATLISKINELPPLPAVAIELLKSFDNDDIDTATIARQIGRDQALTAKTLRIANSSFYGLTGKVSSIPDAIAILGFRTIRSLVTASAIASTLPTAKSSQFDYRAFWSHSTGVALAARLLAKRLGQAPESAFTAGLLHNLGCLLLAACFPHEYDAALRFRSEHDCPLLEAEQKALGIDHTAAGDQLAKAWHFPASLRSAIAEHHSPQVGAADPVAHIVHIADILVHGLGLAHLPGESVPPLDIRVWQEFGFTVEILQALLSNIDSEMNNDELAAIFSD